MNTRQSTLALLLIAALATPTTATSDTPAARPFAFPVSSVTGEGFAPVQLGMLDDEVARMVGYPYRRLSSNVWLYRWCSTADTNLAAQQGCNVLAITFVNRCVADMKLLNAAAVNVIVSAANAGTKVTYVTTDKSDLFAAAEQPKATTP